MKKDQLIELFKRYREGSIKSDEKILLENWVIFSADTAPMISDLQFQQDIQDICFRLKQDTKRKPIMKFGVASAVAALLLIGFGIIIIIHVHGYRGYKNLKQTLTDIQPGTNKATLRLASGKIIDLDSTQTTIFISNKDIKYADGTKVDVSSFQPSAMINNSISTPRGGQYQIILIDGTKVWLNAASTLSYPTKFSRGIREVEIEGEAYFEISKNHSLPGTTSPFIVKCKGQTITVLGTEFNISAFKEDAEVKSTLVEGAIKIESNDKHPTNNLPENQEVNLLPGQQSILSGNGLFKRKVNISRTIAWKNGAFDFTGKSIKQVMSELERWYDLKVIYDGDVADMKFFGKIRRNSPLSKVLEVLEDAQVNFKIENGNKLIIHSN